MCYRKITLKNRILDSHRSGFDKEFIKAPCCSCPSCRKVKANDWFVRGYFEFLENSRQAFFVTLDFDEDHLPRWRGKPCFDSETMKHFLMRLRYYVGKFRYFYACEYGGLLKRPHIHAIILPENKIDSIVFFQGVSRSWYCGRHFDIENIDSVGQNKLAALEYLTSYTTKDITWEPNDFEDYQDMPSRFRPRTQASKGFGYSALENGSITVDMMLKGQKVVIPCGKNGKEVLFPIPRYYYMKVGYDYIWHPDLMKAELIKNDLGVQFAVSSHNRQYVHYIKSFFASRLDGLEPIDGTGFWYNQVLDVLDDFEDFKEFVFYRPFISFFGNSFVTDNIRNESLYRPSWFYYERVCSYYDNWKRDLDLSKCRIETEKMVIGAKIRAHKKISRNVQLYNYLKRKNFDFSSLNY